MIIHHLPLAALRVAFVLGVASASHARNDGEPPFAFPADPVSFSNGDVRLAGAILKLAGNGPFPAVVVVHGAGPAVFDEVAFRVHANAFVRAGFAVLLYDKRGSGRSAGKLDTADYGDLAADLAAGVRFLRARADIALDKIGILGRSEGGWVGTLAASRDPKIAFMIMSSGSALRPSVQTMFWTRGVLSAKGAKAEEIEAAVHAITARWSYYRRVAQDEAWGRSAAGQSEREAVEKRLRSFARLAPEISQSVADPLREPPAYFRAFVQRIDYDPTLALRTVRAPLLAVIGAQDDVVDPASTISAFERLRANGGDFTVRMLPGVGHPLIIMTDQGPRYPEDYPEFAVRWARERVDSAKRPHLGQRSGRRTGARERRRAGRSDHHLTRRTGPARHPVWNRAIRPSCARRIDHSDAPDRGLRDVPPGPRCGPRRPERSAARRMREGTESRPASGWLAARNAPMPADEIGS